MKVKVVSLPADGENKLFAVLDYDCFSKGDEVTKKSGEKVIVEKVVAGVPKIVGSDDFHVVYKVIGKIHPRASWVKAGDTVTIDTYTKEDVDRLKGFFDHYVGEPCLRGIGFVSVMCECCKDYK